MNAARLRSLVVVIAACLGTGRAATGQQGDLLGAARQVEQVRRLTRVDLQGRGAAQVGGERAAYELAQEFQRIGLRVSPALESRLQPVPLERIRIGQHSRLAIGGEEARWGTEVVALPTDMNRGVLPRNVLVRGDPLFVGYGIDDQVAGWSDIAHTSLRDQVVVVLGGTPPGIAIDRWAAADRAAIIAALARRGASAVLVVSDGAISASVRLLASRESVRLTRVAAGAPRPIPVAWVDESLARAMFGLSRWKAAREKAQRGPIRRPFRGTAVELLIDLEVTPSPADAFNVVGWLPGSDAARSKEAVVVVAHYDAFGRQPDGSTLVGAVDNALGVARLLAVASALASRSTPLARSVVFVATTAEEALMLGSFHAVSEPIWPLGRIAAVVNIDGIGSETWGPVQTLHAIGFGLSDVDSLLVNVAAAHGLRVEPDGYSAARLNQRSDHFEFARRGIPTVYPVGYPAALGALGDRIGAEVASRIHQAADTAASSWSLSGIATMTSVTESLVVGLAQAVRWPVWRSGHALAKPRGSTPRYYRVME